MLRLVPRIGDFLVPGTPVLAVHGGQAPPRRVLRYALSVGVERTFHQDLGFGLRQLSDIALRALSSAVNDPTTAVQALDRIVQILAALSRRPLDRAVHRDRRGTLRLVRPVPGWEDLVDLGFTEIRACGAGNAQVTRRMLAGLDDLLRLAPPQRRARRCGGTVSCCGRPSSGSPRLRRTGPSRCFRTGRASVDPGGVRTGRPPGSVAVTA